MLHFFIFFRALWKVALISFIWFFFLSSFQNRTWTYFCWHCIFFYWNKKKKKKTCYKQQFIRLEMSKNKKYTNIILLETSLILRKSWNDSMCWGRKGSNHSITDYALVWLFSETFFWMCIQKPSGTKPPRNYCLFFSPKGKTNDLSTAFPEANLQLHSKHRLKVIYCVFLKLGTSWRRKIT